MKLMIHGEGDSAKGLGHLVRALGLAFELSPQHEIIFAVSAANLSTAEALKSQLSKWYAPHDFSIIALGEISPLPHGDNGWRTAASATQAALVKAAKSANIDVLISDGKFEWSPSEVEQLATTAKLILIDNLAPSRGLADFVIYPTGHASDEMIAPIKPERLRTGLEWSWIHPAAKKLSQASASQTLQCTISMGGADPEQLTLRLMKAISTILPEGKKAVVIGRSFSHAAEVKALGNQLKNWEFIDGGESAFEAFKKSKSVVCAFGITVYECMAMGIPTGIVPHDYDSAADANLLLKRYPNAGFLLKDTSEESVRIFLNRKKNDTLDSTLTSKIGQLSTQISALI